MKVLITGGAGFIGSHVTELFCDLGYSVTVVDDLRFGYERFVDSRAKFVKGSIGDSDLMEKVLEEVGVVIHLAASSIISFSYEDPVGYFQNNLTNGLVLLEAMRKKNVKKIIYSSTASVYGEPKKVPIKESHVKTPISSYGASKLAFEQALSCYYYSYGIESTSLRYYNAYGPRDEQQPRSRAVPMWIEDILSNRAIRWFWQGKQTRDYVYVRDIAEAHIAVLGLGGLHVFNVGSGEGIIMRDILYQLENIVGRKLETIDQGSRSGDPMKLIADISNIKKKVGWRPKVSLEEGLKKTFAYYQSQKI